MCVAANGNLASFEGTVRTVFEDAVVYHGDLALRWVDYARRLQGILEKCTHGECTSAAAVSMLQQLHTRDLYLSTACAAHADLAWHRFNELYRKYINDIIAHLCSSPAIVGEIQETICSDLFLPDTSGRSRIYSYDGRSSLATWLRVVVTNRIINEGERKCNRLHHDEARPEFEDHAVPVQLKDEGRVQE